MSLRVYGYRRDFINYRVNDNARTPAGKNPAVSHRCGTGASLCDAYQNATSPSQRRRIVVRGKAIVRDLKQIREQDGKFLPAHHRTGRSGKVR